MPTDHDQLFKSLLKEFLPEFFSLFFPELAPRFDFTRVEWLDAELFPDPPAGERRLVDLVARLPFRQGDEAEAAGPESIVDVCLSLVHVEIEGSDSLAIFSRRMFWYFANLNQKHEAPVLPIANFLHLGLDGVGVRSYDCRFGTFDVLRFQFLYIGLPRLAAADYIERENLLAPALAARMRPPPEGRPWLKAEAEQRIAVSAANPHQKHILLRCVETYLLLSDQEYRSLLQSESYSEVNAMVLTTYDRGVEQGRVEGRNEGRVETLRESITVLLEDRFGALAPEIRRRIAEFPAEGLLDLLKRSSRAASMDELGF